MIFTNASRVPSEVYEAMGISDQSSKWQETLALKDHYGFTIGYCLTPVLSIAIVTLTVQDTPLENPRKKNIFYEAER